MNSGPNTKNKVTRPTPDAYSDTTLTLTRAHTLNTDLLTTISIVSYPALNLALTLTNQPSPQSTNHHFNLPSPSLTLTPTNPHLHSTPPHLHSPLLVGLCITGPMSRLCPSGWNRWSAGTFDRRMRSKRIVCTLRHNRWVTTVMWCSGGFCGVV